MVYHRPHHSGVATHSVECITVTQSPMTVSVDTIYMDLKPSHVVVRVNGDRHHVVKVSVIVM